MAIRIFMTERQRKKIIFFGYETKPNDKFQGDVKDFILIRDKESGTAIVKSRG